MCWDFVLQHCYCLEDVSGLYWWMKWVWWVVFCCGFPLGKGELVVLLVCNNCYFLSWLSRGRIAWSNAGLLWWSVVVWSVWSHCWAEGLLLAWCENTSDTFGKVGKCDLWRMGVQNLQVGCISAGFEKGEVVCVICQCSISGSQVLQKVVVLHHLILLNRWASNYW